MFLKMMLPYENTFKTLFKNVFGITVAVPDTKKSSVDRPRGPENRKISDQMLDFSHRICFVLKSRLYVIDVYMT